MPSEPISRGELESRYACLAMFVRRMLRVMSMNGLGDREVYRQATIYIKSIGATGSILRDVDIQEQADSTPQQSSETSDTSSYPQEGEK